MHTDTFAVDQIRVVGGSLKFRRLRSQYRVGLRYRERPMVRDNPQSIQPMPSEKIPVR